MGEVYERRLNVGACVYVCACKNECMRAMLHSRSVNIKEPPVHLDNRIVSFSIKERIRD